MKLVITGGLLACLVNNSSAWNWFWSPSDDAGEIETGLTDSYDYDLKEPKCGYRNIYGANGDVEDSVSETNLNDPEDPTRFTNRNIVGGDATDIGEFPWMVSFRDPISAVNFCGGTLLNRWTIVTAAHCFSDGYNKNWKLEHFKVAIGWSSSFGKGCDVGDDDKKFGTAVYPIDFREGKTKKGEVKIHPGWFKGASKEKIQNHHDIALVILHKEVRFPKRADAGIPGMDLKKVGEKLNDKQSGTFVRPLCLPSSDDKKTYDPRLLDKWGNNNEKNAKKNFDKAKPHYLLISGYGNTDADNEDGKGEGGVKQRLGEHVQSNSLLKGTVYGMDNDKCAKRMNKAMAVGKKIKVANTQVCAQYFSYKKGGKYQDTCQGDSGGPLIYKLDKCKINGMGGYEMQRCDTKRHEANLRDPDNKRFFQNVLYGITSFGLGCGGKKNVGGKVVQTPGIYTRVSEYVDWIKANAKNPEYLQYADPLDSDF